MSTRPESLFGLPWVFGDLQARGSGYRYKIARLFFFIWLGPHVLLCMLPLTQFPSTLTVDTPLSDYRMCRQRGNFRPRDLNPSLLVQRLSSSAQQPSTRIYFVRRA